MLPLCVLLAAMGMAAAATDLEAAIREIPLEGNFVGARLRGGMGGAKLGDALKVDSIAHLEPITDDAAFQKFAAEFGGGGRGGKPGEDGGRGRGGTPSRRGGNGQDGEKREGCVPKPPKFSLSAFKADPCIRCRYLATACSLKSVKDREECVRCRSCK